MIPEKSHREASKSPSSFIHKSTSAPQYISSVQSQNSIVDDVSTVVKIFCDIDNSEHLAKYSVNDFRIENLISAGLANQLNIVHLYSNDYSQGFDFQSLVNIIKDKLSLKVNNDNNDINSQSKLNSNE